MSTEDPPTQDSPTRQRIIETMRRLVSELGEGKVTVVDVARTLGMSHANVYRFFRSKVEIIDAVMDAWLADVEAFIKRVAAGPGTPSERVEAVAVAIYRRRRSKYEKDPKMFLAFRRLIETRPDAVAKRKKALFDVLFNLIKEGIASGEFASGDALAAAQVVEDATAIFLHPLSIPMNASQPTEERLIRVVRTVLAGMGVGLDRASLSRSARPAKPRGKA